MALGAKYVRTAAREAWGPVNSVKQVAPGVWQADTWGHGGFLVAVGPDEPFQLNEQLRVKRFYCTGWTRGGTPVLDFYQFEEDCDYAVLFAAHPEVLEAYNRKQAKGFAAIGQPYMPLAFEDVLATVLRWNPEYRAVARP